MLKLRKAKQKRGKYTAADYKAVIDYFLNNEENSYINISKALGYNKAFVEKAVSAYWNRKIANINKKINNEL